MLKRILAMVLCLSLLLSITACSVVKDLANGDLSGLNSITEFFTGKQSSEGEISFPSSPSVNLPEAPKTAHTPLSKESYYQYSLLDENDKNLYNDICTAIETQQNFVKITKYNLTAEKLRDMYNIVVADNPQYFWLAKFMEYSYYSIDDKTTITHLILSYTDGQTTDKFDNDNNFVSTADREKIKTQKIEFDNSATAFLNTVKTDIPTVEKERLIHDFVLKTINYAENDKDKQLTHKNYMRIYDIYGALVNKSAVCEGYAKLFQYLCYQVGINSASVYGWSEGESHAWNTVYIENEWYHVDTTWDDGSTNGLPLYNYFNLSEKQIKTDHTIDTEVFPVPKATSTKKSFANTYGISISKHSKPKNYQAAIDYMVKYDCDYLILICEGDLINQDYLKRYCFKLNSDIQKYIKVKNYNISFEQSYYTIENFVYLIKK